MMIKINDERGFEQSTLYFGYLEENNSTTIEFEFPEYLEKYNKKLNFMLADGTTVCKLFDDINSNKFTFTRDLLKFNKLQMAIEFFDTNEDLIYRTSILTIRISDSIICDDDVTEDDPKIIILDELIQKVNELNTETTENEATRESNEQTRISNENTRISNENKRIEEENKRISAESTRVSNEEKRVESENLRITQEETRQSNESTRTSNEEIREENETQRIANEEIRQENANQLSSTIEKKMNKTTEKVNLIEVSTESGAKGINGNVVENPANTFKTFNVEGINEVYVNGRNHWPNEPLVIFYDNTDALISYIDTGVNSQTCQDFKVEVPENAVNMIVNGRTSDPIEAISSAYYYKYLDFKDSFNNEIERVLKLIPSRTTQISETIDIDDSSESDLNELKAFGNSKQGSTTGAQLLEITNDDLDNGDLKVTNNNGILRIVGTPPDVNYNKQIGTFVCEESGVYCLKDNVSRIDERIRIIYRINDSNWINGNPSYLLELQAGDIVHFNLRVDSVQYFDETMKPMFNKGTTALEWEPYTGGNPSPNPDYPQEIESIKDSITFKRIGKNYFNSEIEMGGYTAAGIKYASNTRVRSVNSFILKPGTYTISCPTATAIAINSAYENKEQTIYDNNVLTITLEEEQNCVLTVETTDLLNAKIQIEKGTEATEYEPYHEDKYTLPVQEEMLEEDTFEKIDGNWYEVHNRTFYECTGEENWLREEINSSGKYRYGFYNYQFGTAKNRYSESICTHFKNFNQYGVVDNTFGIEQKSIRFNFNPLKTFNSVEEFKNWLVEQKNGGIPVRIYYYLETPTKLPCTAEQITVLNQLEQFSLDKGINHIYSDDELSPKFQLKYYQDINILLDKINKNIADVSAQLIEGGSNV